MERPAGRGRSSLAGALMAMCVLATACVGGQTDGGTDPGGEEPSRVFLPRPDDRLDTSSDRNLPYTSERSLDVYRPVDDGPWPSVVLFHGGEDEKANYRFFARDIAEQGVVVFVPQYRSTPAELDPAPLGALEDAACAMRFARTHANEYAGTAERVIAAGYSLGGNLAAVMSVTDGTGFVGDCLVSSDVSAHADGLVGLDAVYDFAELRRRSFGVDEVGPEWDAYVTTAYLDDAAPQRTVIFTGTTDELRLYGEQLRDALSERGWDVTYVNLPVSHGGFVSIANGTTDAIAATAHDEAYAPDNG